MTGASMNHFTTSLRNSVTLLFRCEPAQFKINRHLGKSQIADLRCFLTRTAALGGTQQGIDQIKVLCITMGLCNIGCYSSSKLRYVTKCGEVSC